jgi:hypothetical protein
MTKTASVIPVKMGIRPYEVLRAKRLKRSVDASHWIADQVRNDAGYRVDKDARDATPVNE